MTLVLLPTLASSSVEAQCISTLPASRDPARRHGPLPRCAHSRSSGSSGCSRRRLRRGPRRRRGLRHARDAAASSGPSVGDRSRDGSSRAQRASPSGHSCSRRSARFPDEAWPEAWSAAIPHEGDGDWDAVDPRMLARLVRALPLSSCAPEPTSAIGLVRAHADASYETSVTSACVNGLLDGLPTIRASPRSGWGQVRFVFVFAVATR